MMNDPNEGNRRSKIFVEGSTSESHRTSIGSMERIPFDKDQEIVVFIDGASGLPPTTTATRLHTSLYLPSKQKVHESVSYAYCDLESDHLHPSFATKIRWKGGCF
jgi:hypothetical protein